MLVQTRRQNKRMHKYLQIRLASHLWPLCLILLISISPNSCHSACANTNPNFVLILAHLPRMNSNFHCGFLAFIIAIFRPEPPTLTRHTPAFSPHSREELKRALDKCMQVASKKDRPKRHQSSRVLQFNVFEDGLAGT